VQALFNYASVQAHLGEFETATKAADGIVAWAERKDDACLQMSAAGVIGFIALSRQDIPAARSFLDRWAAQCQVLGLVDPGISRYDGDLVGALLASGATEPAAEVTRGLATRATRSGRISASAVAARCRGLVDSSAGDHAGAIRHLEEALTVHGECAVPFEEARTRLALGIVLRRGKRKREAAQELADARDAFARLRSSAWTSRAESELGRVSAGRSTATDLAPTERRVAELAASGLTKPRGG